MSSSWSPHPSLVHSLATLLRNKGDAVLDGSSTLTLEVTSLQHLTRLFQQFLLSRTHQHGFLALPSHPADTTPLLQVQFLFDMLQKTISLKLVHPPGAALQSRVKIFPFKSLKHLELKRVPSHCLEGLQGVYSQLEVFICSKSISSLEELLSLCGGDLSSALPWLELHTLNFSYNSISCLDGSLNLLNVLKSLDLSHNKIKDCAEYLKPLSELEHLNLAYNNLQRVPVLGQNAQARLVTLVLRNNELETIDGVEIITSLQHLDLAYNLLMQHSGLAPLSTLHNLKTLTLEGNPLYFQKSHRTSTACQLSPRTALNGLRLDGVALTPSEIAVLRKPRQTTGQIYPTCQVSMASKWNVQEATSSRGELSDSLSTCESGPSRARRKKSRNKVKVRTASISEPSDTDHEPKSAALQDMVLHHQKDVERMDSFRERMGEDWLLYRHHLNLPSAPFPTTQVDGVENKDLSKESCTFSTSCNKTDGPKIESLPSPLLSSELKRKEEEESLDLQPETESTLLWMDHTESTLETSIADPRAGENCFPEATPAEEEELDLGVDLCKPILVGVLTEIGESEGNKASKPLFLRVQQASILEVDVHQGRVRGRLELDSLIQVTTSQASWMEKEKEEPRPTLALYFSYINRERQKRQYIVLDDDPQEALQALVEVLSAAVEENGRLSAEGKAMLGRLQCLKCRAEFNQPENLKMALSDADDPQEHQKELEGKRCSDDAVSCPECNSSHVVHLVGQSAPSTSTPVPFDAEQNHDSCFRFDDVDAATHAQKPLILDESILSSSSSLQDATCTDHPTLPEGATETFHTAHSGLSNILSNDSITWPDHLIDTGRHRDSKEHNPVEPLDSCSDFQELRQHLSPDQIQESSHALSDLLSEDVVTVDHRLKLFLDVEVFEEEEEILCFLKMSAVKFGNPVEFLSLVVVSDRCIYILEMTSQSEQGHPSDWLKKRESYRLQELSNLEVGLGSQSIHMEFDGGAAAYTLLVRDSGRCKTFFSRLTGIARELAPKSDSKLKSISTTRLDPRHHLWPLVCEDQKTGAEDNRHPPFLYLLVFLKLGDSLISVTVLATQEKLYLLDEDHQWNKSCLKLQPSDEDQAISGAVTVREAQPISCVSSIRLWSSDQCRVDVRLYDEAAKEEKTWILKAEAVQEVQCLVNWIKNQWESMFGVKLNTAIE